MASDESDMNMNVKFRVVLHEDHRVGQVSGMVPDYPQTPMNSLVDAIQMAVLEAGFSFEAEVLDMAFDYEEV